MKLINVKKILFIIILNFIYFKIFSENISSDNLKINKYNYEFEDDFALELNKKNNNFYNNVKFDSKNLNIKKYDSRKNFFWELSSYDFNRTNPSYIKRIAYDLINNKEYYKYYKIISMIGLSGLSLKLLSPFYNKFEKNLEKEGMRNSVDEIAKNIENKLEIKKNILNDLIKEESKKSIYEFVYQFINRFINILLKHETTIYSIIREQGKMITMFSKKNQNIVNQKIAKFIYDIGGKNNLINKLFFQKASNLFYKNHYEIDLLINLINNNINNNDDDDKGIELKHFKFIFNNWTEIKSILEDPIFKNSFENNFLKDFSFNLNNIINLIDDLFNYNSNININSYENTNINFKLEDIFDNKIMLKIKDSTHEINIFNIFKDIFIYTGIDLFFKDKGLNIKNLKNKLNEKEDFIKNIKKISSSDKNYNFKELIDFWKKHFLVGFEKFEIPNINKNLKKLYENIKISINNLNEHNISKKLIKYYYDLKIFNNKKNNKEDAVFDEEKIKNYRILLKNSGLIEKEDWLYNSKGIVDREISKSIEYGSIYPMKKYLERSWKDKGFLTGIGAYIYFAPSFINPFKFAYNTILKASDHFSTENMYPGIKILSPNDLKVSKNNIGGLFLVKQIFGNLVEKLDFQKNTKKQGVGFVLHGGPGTGKTLSAELLAKELGYYMIYIDSASIVPTKDSKYTTASALKYIFQKAVSMKNCILLFDEMDRLITTEEIASEILKLLDMYLKNTNIIVIATTNNLNKFSQAMIRPGRLSNVIFVDKPSYKERYDILNKFFENNNFKSENSNLLSYLTNITQDFSSASIKELISNIITKTTLLETNMVTYNIVNESFFKLTLGNKYTGFDLNKKYLNNSSILMAAELYYLLKNEELYSYNIVYATIKPYEKNYKENVNFCGSIYKVNKNELNKEINNKSLILNIESMLIKVAAEDIIFKDRSIYSKEYIEKAKEYINTYILMNYKYLKENEIKEKGNEIYNKIYWEMMSLLKENNSYLENIKKVAELLINQEIISGKEIIDIIKSENATKNA